MSTANIECLTEVDDLGELKFRWTISPKFRQTQAARRLDKDQCKAVLSLYDPDSLDKTVRYGPIFWREDAELVHLRHTLFHAVHDGRLKRYDTSREWLEEHRPERLPYYCADMKMG